MTTDYRVRSGDTLSKIAREHHTTKAELLALNSIIQDENHIEAGWVLQLPDTFEAGTPAAKSPLEHVVSDREHEPMAKALISAFPEYDVSRSSTDAATWTLTAKEAGDVTQTLTVKGQRLTLSSDNSGISATLTLDGKHGVDASDLPGAVEEVKRRLEQNHESLRTGSYQVRPGDTLFQIARDFQTTVGELQAKNGLKGSEIVSGQTLQLPV